MKMLYTANGRYIRCCTEEGTRPVIIVCEKEYEVDVQEFMLWSILNWRILREEEISSFYEKMASSSNVTIHRSWQDCVQRLLVRGLLVVGTGDTEYVHPYGGCTVRVRIWQWQFHFAFCMELPELFIRQSHHAVLRIEEKPIRS